MDFQAAVDAYCTIWVKGRKRSQISSERSTVPGASYLSLEVKGKYRISYLRS